MTLHCQETKALLHRGGGKQWGGDGREGEGGGWEGERVARRAVPCPGFPLESLPLAFSSSDFGQDWPALSPPQGSSAAIWVLSAGYKHEAGLVFASGFNVPGLNSLTACLTRCPTPVQGLECSRHST